MRRSGRTSCLLLAALLLPLLAAPAGAANEPVTGYWSRTQTGAPVPVEPPTPAPEGGSWISGDPSGPVAVAAVRADAEAGQVVAGLSLPIADAVGETAVVVCPTTETWVPQQNGRLEAAPVADCSAPVEARVDEERLLVDLPPALQAETVDLLLAPAEGAVFSLTLDRATAEAVVQAPGAATAPPPDLPPPPANQPTDAGTGSSGGVLLPPLAPMAGAAPPPLLSPALPSASPVPAPAPQAAPPAPQLAVAPRALAEPDSRGALLGAIVLAALGALTIRLAGQPAAAPRLLGGGARLRRADAVAVPVPVDGSDRGVGRFRTQRVRPPVRI